jgi:hypothetical protein
MCNLYSITTNQAAIIALFRVVNRYVGNLAPMPGVFPDYPAPVVRNTDTGRELSMMRWGMPPPPKSPWPPVANIRTTTSPHWRVWLRYPAISSSWSSTSGVSSMFLGRKAIPPTSSIFATTWNSCPQSRQKRVG